MEKKVKKKVINKKWECLHVVILLTGKTEKHILFKQVYFFTEEFSYKLEI